MTHEPDSPKPAPDPSEFEGWSLSEPMCNKHRGSECAHCRQCRQDGWNAAVAVLSRLSDEAYLRDDFNFPEAVCRAALEVMAQPDKRKDGE